MHKDASLVRRVPSDTRRRHYRRRNLGAQDDRRAVSALPRGALGWRRLRQRKARMPDIDAAGRLALTIAISDYDHVRDFASGLVCARGIEANFLTIPVEEIFFRFTKFREWDVSEMSLAKYAALRAQDDASLSAIPVFPSRLFRHSSIYVRKGGPIHAPEDLRGRKVGLPEWAQTAAVWSRGALVHQYG